MEGYIQEMQQGGYSPENVDEFHYVFMRYLAGHYFPDKKSKICDIGIGAGHCTIPLLKLGYKNVYGVDIDDYNARTFERMGIQFFKADVERDELPFQAGFFDVIICFHLIEHLFDPSNFLNECKRILKDGGKLILATPDWRKQYKTFWRDPTHRHPYDKVSLTRLLRIFGFKILRCSSLGCIRGIGRTKLWKTFPFLMFTGLDIIAIAVKKKEE